MSKKDNPWKGVVPYSDDPEDLKIHPFRGRDKAIKELLSIINENEITTLYGRSGIGKTSLINAGLFPKLRQLGCYPVSIRLYDEIEDKESSDINFAEYIINRLRDIAYKIGSDTADINSSTDAESNQESVTSANAVLWHFFASNRFLYEGKETIPVVVLDQFEEILMRKPEAAVVLLRQLREAKNEKYRNDGSLFEVNFRFVISIREDDLFLLEDALDFNYIDKMKTGRYRLQPIEKEAAINEIIFIREGLFDKDKDIIAERLIKLSDQDGAVSSILLSLVCSRAYELSPNGIITLNETDKLGEKPLNSFYKDSIKDFPEEFIAYFERHFVHETRRRIVSEKDIPPIYLQYIHKLENEKNQYRLLTTASEKKGKGKAYELLHDKLVDAVLEYQTERIAIFEETARKKRLKKWLCYIAVFLALTVVAVIVIRIANRPINYTYKGDYHGKSVPIHSRGYVVNDSVLCLSGCEVDDYTFYGNKEVRRVELDSVATNSTSVFLPNADTLVIGPRQWSIGMNHSSFPNITTVVAKRPATNSISRYERFDHLDTAIIDKNDLDNLKWDSKTKTLFARNDKTDKWAAYLSKYSHIYTTDPDIYKTDGFNGSFVKDYDIANPPEAKDEDNKIYYRLINSDSSKHTVSAKDLPSNSSKVKFIDLNYIDSIGEDLFCYYYVEDAIFRDVQYIGKRSFSYFTTNNRILLPSVVKICDSAFFNTAFDSIILESVVDIGKKAFARDNTYSRQIKKVILPKVERLGDSVWFNNGLGDYTYLSYNKKAQKGKNVFERLTNNDGLFTDQSEQHYKTKNDGYHISMDTLFIDSAKIELLYIGEHIKDIRVNQQLNEFSVEKIKCDYGNSRFFTYHGNLYERTGYTNADKYAIPLLIKRNSIKQVSQPQVVGYYQTFPYSTEKCREFICLNRSDISNLKNKQQIDLYIPYGQFEVYRSYETMFNSVKELSWIATIWYRLFYSKVIDVSLLHLPFMGNQIASIDDIFAFLCCIAVMLTTLVLTSKLKWRRAKWWDYLLQLVFAAIIFILISPNFFPTNIYTTSDGKTFYSINSLFEYLKCSESVISEKHVTMWPSLLFATPLWIIYLWATRKLNNRNTQTSKTSTTKSTP